VHVFTWNQDAIKHEPSDLAMPMSLAACIRAIRHWFSVFRNPRLSSRARGGEGKFLVFYAQEEVVEEDWLFRFPLICYREGGDVPKMWTECSER
jgi:hypothetical protein